MSIVWKTADDACMHSHALRGARRHWSDPIHESAWKPAVFISAGSFLHEGCGRQEKKCCFVLAGGVQSRVQLYPLRGRIDLTLQITADVCNILVPTKHAVPSALPGGGRAPPSALVSFRVGSLYAAASSALASLRSGLKESVVKLSRRGSGVSVVSKNPGFGMPCPRRL